MRAALESELAGDNRHAPDALLRQALYDSPNDAFAHWDLRQIRMQGRWQSLGEVEQAARGDKRRAECGGGAMPGGLRRRSGRPGPLVPENRLDERAASALVVGLCSSSRTTSRRFRSLGCGRIRGCCSTPTQVEDLKAELAAGVAGKGGPLDALVAQWAKGGGKTAIRAIPTAVREKIAKIADRGQCWGWNERLWRQVAAKRQTRLYREMMLALMPVLGGDPQPAAAESLVRHAVFASSEEVRTAAIAGLKAAPLGPRLLR